MNMGKKQSVLKNVNVILFSTQIEVCFVYEMTQVINVSNVFGFFKNALRKGTLTLVLFNEQVYYS